MERRILSFLSPLPPAPFPVGAGGENLGISPDPPVGAYGSNRGLQTWNASRRSFCFSRSHSGEGEAIVIIHVQHNNFCMTLSKARRAFGELPTATPGEKCTKKTNSIGVPQEAWMGTPYGVQMVCESCNPPVVATRQPGATRRNA